jgi:MFS family permease
MAGEAVSMVGAWMQMAAQSWLLTTLTQKAWVLGAVSFAGGIPMLLLTMVGGSFADRFDKRRILYVVLATQIALATLVGWLVATGHIAIWQILVVTTLLGIAAAFEVPAVSAFVPELVANEDISKALAIDRSVFHATRLIGPALGGWLIGKFGVPTAYYMNALSFFALIAAISTIASRPRGTDEEEEQRKGPMREGLAFVRNDAPTRAMVLLMGGMTIFISPFLMIIMPLYSRIELGLGAEEMGTLIGISGFGSFVGSLGLLSIPKGRRALFLKCGATAVTIGIGGLALAHSMFTAGASLIVMTLGLSTSYGTANIVIQERAPDAIRGRVSAVAGMAFFGILPFSGLIVSSLADVVGLRLAMGCATAGYALTAAVLLLGRRQLSSAPAA